MSQKLTQPEEVDLVIKGIAMNDLKVKSTGHDKKNLNGVTQIGWSRRVTLAWWNRMEPLVDEVQECVKPSFSHFQTLPPAHEISL